MYSAYNHKLRGHIARFAINLYANVKKRHANIPEEVVKIVKQLPRKKALYKLELMTLKTLRKAWMRINIDEIINPTG